LKEEAGRAEQQAQRLSQEIRAQEEAQRLAEEAHAQAEQEARKRAEIETLLKEESRPPADRTSSPRQS